MRINKFYTLNRAGRPMRNFYNFSPANEELYDEKTIVNYPKDRFFTPIVIDKERIRSRQTYNTQTFLKCLYLLRSLKDGEIFISGGVYHTMKRIDDVHWWGCRTFSRTQINTIIKAIEWHLEN